MQDERVKKYRIRVQMVGDRSLLPDDLREVVDAAEAATRDHDGFCLNIALAYGEERDRAGCPRDPHRSCRQGTGLDTSMSRWWSSTSTGEKGYPPLT